MTITKYILKAWLADNPVTTEDTTDLNDGNYTLTVTTQYKGTSNDYLKTPRSTSQTIYIDGAPQTPGTGGGRKDEGEEGTFG